MTGWIPGTTSVTPIVLWIVGAAILGLALVYAVLSAGRLRRSEREQLDRTTRARRESEGRTESFEEQRPARIGPARHGPYAIVVPIAVACLAVVLIALVIGSNQEAQHEHTTTGRAPAKQTQQQVQPPVTPGSDASSDSARGPEPPLTENR